MEMDYDIIVAGAGLTGLVVARECLAKGLKVLVLERGEEYRPPADPQRADLIRLGWWSEETREVPSDRPGAYVRYRNEWQASELFDDLAEIEAIHGPWAFRYNMRFGIGGSAKVWSGMTWRLLPDDFQCRTKFGHSADWAVGYDDLCPFYDEAEAMLGVSGPCIEDRSIWPWETHYPYPSFGRSSLDRRIGDLLAPELRFVEQPHAAINDPQSAATCIGSKTCVQRCPTGALFHPDERWLNTLVFDDNFHLETNAYVVDMPLTAQGQKVSGVRYVQDGELRTATADFVVLAANTVENLMILSRTAREAGRPVCDRSGHLGRGFASHGAVTFSLVAEEPLLPAQGRPTHVSAINPMLETDRAIQHGHVVEVWNSDFSYGYAPWEQYWNMHDRQRAWGRSLFDQVREYEHRCQLAYIFETEMSPDKRLVESETLTGRYNTPLARALTYPTERDQAAQDHVMRSGLALNGRPGIRQVECSGCGLNGNHPLGGYRMSESPQDGVVNSFGIAHDVGNLALFGGGMFCSTGVLNPTLTITALALRGIRNILG